MYSLSCSVRGNGQGAVQKSAGSSLPQPLPPTCSGSPHLSAPFPCLPSPLLLRVRKSYGGHSHPNVLPHLQCHPQTVNPPGQLLTTCTLTPTLLRSSRPFLCRCFPVYSLSPSTPVRIVPSGHLSVPSRLCHTALGTAGRALQAHRAFRGP